MIFRGPRGLGSTSPENILHPAPLNNFNRLARYCLYANDCRAYRCLIFEATTGRPVLSLLRPGKRPSGEEVEQILRHVIGRIHRNWPAVEIMVRGDSHFATPEVMDLLEQKRCGYIFGLSTNMRLTEIGRPWSEDVATRRALSKSEKMPRFFQTSYAAAS